MRADELMKVEMLWEGVWTFGTFTDYINQLRYERLMAKANEYK